MNYPKLKKVNYTRPEKILHVSEAYGAKNNLRQLHEIYEFVVSGDKPTAVIKEENCPFYCTKCGIGTNE